MYRLGIRWPLTIDRCRLSLSWMEELYSAQSGDLAKPH
jgi:hypothetical protein